MDLFPKMGSFSTSNCRFISLTVIRLEVGDSIRLLFRGPIPFAIKIA